MEGYLNMLRQAKILCSSAYSRGDLRFINSILQSSASSSMPEKGSKPVMSSKRMQPKAQTSDLKDILPSNSSGLIYLIFDVNGPWARTPISDGWRTPRSTSLIRLYISLISILSSLKFEWISFLWCKYFIACKIWIMIPFTSWISCCCLAARYVFKSPPVVSSCSRWISWVRNFGWNYITKYWYDNMFRCTRSRLMTNSRNKVFWHILAVYWSFLIVTHLSAKRWPSIYSILTSLTSKLSLYRINLSFLVDIFSSGWAFCEQTTWLSRPVMLFMASFKPTMPVSAPKLIAFLSTIANSA